MGLACCGDFVVEGKLGNGAKLVEERHHTTGPVETREHAQEDEEEEDNAWAMCCTVAVGRFGIVLVLEDCTRVGGRCCLWQDVLDWWHIQGSGKGSTQHTTVSYIPG